MRDTLRKGTRSIIKSAATTAKGALISLLCVLDVILMLAGYIVLAWADWRIAVGVFFIHWSIIVGLK